MESPPLTPEMPQQNALKTILRAPTWAEGYLGQDFMPGLSPPGEEPPVLTPPSAASEPETQGRTKHGTQRQSGAVSSVPENSLLDQVESAARRIFSSDRAQILEEFEDFQFLSIRPVQAFEEIVVDGGTGHNLMPQDQNLSYQEAMGPSSTSEINPQIVDNLVHRENQSLVLWEEGSPPDYNSDYEVYQSASEYSKGVLRDVGLLPPLVYRRNQFLPNLNPGQIRLDFDQQSRGGNSGPGTPLLFLEGPRNHTLETDDVEMAEEQNFPGNHEDPEGSQNPNQNQGPPQSVEGLQGGVWNFFPGALPAQSKPRTSPIRRRTARGVWNFFPGGASELQSIFPGA